jgi:hypothetical protein
MMPAIAKRIVEYIIIQYVRSPFTGQFSDLLTFTDFLYTSKMKGVSPRALVL